MGGKSGGHIVTLDQFNGEVDSLALSADGQTLLTGDSDQAIKVWKINRPTAQIHSMLN
ncbi:hypothetical protein [Candidatus Albibeggiatoa sp. nov. BB20]|uniref:hypothetical protein n=1 Tax=Candidatus Albibeggiatoa sp. nov. BB20 TaxID=3162723 RepID=UPI0033656240